MGCYAFIASIIVATTAVATQTNISPPSPLPGFRYVGCVQSETISSSTPVDFFLPFTPAECLSSCPYYSSYVTVGAACHCGPPPTSNVAIEYVLVDGAKCDARCLPDNEANRQCGGAEGYLSMYTREAARLARRASGTAASTGVWPSGTGAVVPSGTSAVISDANRHQNGMIAVVKPVAGFIAALMLL